MKLHSLYTFILVLVLSFGADSFAQHPADTPLSLAIAKLENDGSLASGSCGISAVNMDNGQVLIEHHAQQAMIPASIQKLLTTYTALDKLGSEFQFQTKLVGARDLNTGQVSGNVYIIASGDPTLQSKHYSTVPSTLDRVANALKGDNKFEGRIIVDASIFGKNNTPRGWIWEDMGNYFGATPSALMWRDNTINVFLNSGQVGTPVMLSSKTTGIDDFSLEIDVTASSSNRDDAWFFSAPGSNRIYAKGTIPANRANFLVKASHPKPMEGFAAEILKASGAKTDAFRIDYDYINHDNLETLETIVSPPLYTIVRECNLHSINLYAEALNIQLDKAERGKSVEGGLETITEGMKKFGINMNGVRLIDGSGLSPLNRITASAMTGVLTMAYRSASKDAFMNSLGVAGESGTIKNYFTHPATKGNVKAKSGTMAGVRNYAGYLTNKEGQTIAFCIMLNDYDASKKAQAMKRIEELLIALIES